MSIGQIVPQALLNVSLDAASPLLADPMNVEKQTLPASPFADVLRDISTPGNFGQGVVKNPQHAVSVAVESTVGPDQSAVTAPVDAKLVVSVESDGKTVRASESVAPERIPQDVVDQKISETENPQNVDVSVFGAQFAPLLQFVGRMPESKFDDQSTLATRTLSACALHAAEAVSAIVPQSSLETVTNHEATLKTAQPADAMAGKLPATGNAPLATTSASVAPASVATATLAQSGEANSSIGSTAASSVSVAVPDVHENRPVPVLEAYYQTSVRPTPVPAAVQQAIAPADISSAPVATVTTSVPSAPVVTSESTPVATSAASLVSRPVSVSPVAPVVAESAISVEVKLEAAPLARLTSVTPEPKVVVANTPAPVSVSPSAVAPASVATATLAQSGEANSSIGSTAASSVSVAVPDVHENRPVPVLEAYYQTSVRPTPVPAAVQQAIAPADISSAPVATVTTSVPSTPVVTSESTPVATSAASLVSRPVSVSPVAPVVAESATSVEVKLEAAPLARLTSVTPEPKVVVANTPAPVSVSPPAAVPASVATATLAQSGEANSRIGITAASTVSAAVPAVQQAIIAPADISSAPVATVTASVPSKPAVTSESIPVATSAASLASRPVFVSPVAPVVAESAASVEVRPEAAPLARLTSVTPEPKIVAANTPAPVSVSPPAAVSASVATATLAQSGEANSRIGSTVASSVSVAVPAVQQAIAPADISSAPVATVTASVPSTPVVTSESTPVATSAAPLVSRPVSVSPVVTSVEVKPEAAPLARLTSVTPEPKVVVANTPAPVSVSPPAVAPVATLAQSGEANSSISSTVASSVPVAVPVVHENRFVPVLEAYYQTSVRPTPVAAAVQQTIAPADTSSVPIAPVTASVPSAPAVTSESIPVATSAAALVSRPVSVSPIAPVVAESVTPAGPASVTQHVASVASRVIVTQSRNPEKVVQDVSPLRQNAISENRSAEQSVTLTPEALKEATTFASGESMPENGNDGAEKNLNGQAHLMAIQHKADQPVSITTPAIRDVREPSASVTLENVVQQVKDHLTSRDIKAGTEQVSIRLTPEHMGELKLNMTMENRQLKVEIVAESGMVRDTLLKHADSLRETLAKQNITVESFNVTTGGDRNPSGRDQSDWRELARQQQQNLWMSSGGYRVPKPAAPVMAAMYQSSSNNSMLDIHY